MSTSKKGAASSKKGKRSSKNILSGNKDQLGIGDIVMSILDLTKFQGQHGGGNNNWVLCNGDSYPNSKYAQVAGTPQVPNMIGRYPRGYQPGITPNPGQHQEDTIIDHRHLLEGPDPNRWGIMNDARGGGDNQVARWGYSGQLHTTGATGVTVANETRPKTTVVNFYIRIN